MGHAKLSSCPFKLMHSHNDCEQLTKFNVKYGTTLRLRSLDLCVSKKAELKAES